MNEITTGDLPDVNVWLALLNAQHPHHASAKRYWDSGGEGDIAPASRLVFCRGTMLGLLRLSTNKVVMGGAPYTLAQAWSAWHAVVDLPEVALVAEPFGIDPLLQALTTLPKFRAVDWTDAYLCAFAQLAGLRLVTFDKGFKQYPDLNLMTLS